MSTKEKEVRQNGGGGGVGVSSSSSMKILNDDHRSNPPAPVVMTSVPLSPTKQTSMTIAKSKTTAPKKNKEMDHYVLQTIKNETSEEGGETIDFILTKNNNQDSGLAGPSGEITEELDLSCDEGTESKTEEIVEHVCGKCYKTFRRLKGLKRHIDFCRFDSGYHLRKAEMLKNLEKIEKDAVIMEKKDICFCCGESYDTFHLGHINCPDCPKSFKSQMSYERHIFITHSEFDTYPCTICNAKLRSENLLKLHVDQHQNRGKPFACKICGKDFTRSYHLKRHQKYSSCSASENDSMTCRVCNKTFFRLDNLRSHLKQHLGTHVAKKPEYMCPVCKNCFYSLSTLNIHTRTHTGERPFDCDLCEKKFPSLVALKKHRRYHTGEKPYTCGVCRQSFAVKEVLNRHMKRHTGERPHVCQECGKSFIQASQLRCHAKTHVRPFECATCEEKFKTEKQLLRHSLTHKSRKRKSATDGNKNNEAESSSEVPRKRKSTRKKRTDCAICEKNFDSVQNLQFHILKVHEVDPEEFLNEKPAESEAHETTTKTAAKTPTKLKALKLKTFKINDVKIIGSGDNDPASTSCGVKDTNETNADDNHGDGDVVLQEFIVDEVHDTSSEQTIIVDNKAFTVIPLDSGGAVESVTVDNSSPQRTPGTKKSGRKSLAESLAAAIAEDDDNENEQSEEDLKLKENVGKLLDMLVDSAILKKFGWPQASEETVLCKVIENCGHDLSKDSENYKDCDYGTRMREYVKLLFAVVIHNDSIKELLNNYPIEEVIEYVLGNDDEDEEVDNEQQDDDGEDK